MTLQGESEARIYSNSRVSMIVLAAGLSSRFGRNKMLEPVEKMPLLTHVILTALRSRVWEVVVVSGHDDYRVRSLLQGYGCSIVFNEDFMKGQSFSVRKGFSCVRSDCDAAMIQPGDMALTSEKIVNSVIEKYEQTHAPIVTAGHGGRSGHPILFDKSLFPEIMEIDEETHGLKKVVSNHLSQAILVEAGAGALFDLDTQDDLNRLEKLKLEEGKLRS